MDATAEGGFRKTPTRHRVAKLFSDFPNSGHFATQYCIDSSLARIKNSPQSLIDSSCPVKRAQPDNQ
jgi:hypothetical protein